MALNVLAMQHAFREAVFRNDLGKITDMIQTDPAFDNQFMLRYACSHGKLDIVNLLLQDPRVDPSVQDNAPIKIAAGNGFANIVQRLLQDPRVDPSIHDQYLLKDTIQKGKNEILKILLKDRRVDPSADNEWALRTAIGSNDAQLLEILFTDDRVNPAFNNNFMIENIATYGRTKLMKLFLKHPRVDPTINNQYPLKIAVANGHVETVRELLTDERVDPSVRINEKEQGILRIAIDNGDPNMIKLLLLHPKVDPTVNYQFAIRQAVQLEVLSTVKTVLQDPRVDPTVAPPNQPSAIQNACFAGNIDIITILLEDPRVNTNPVVFEMARNGKFHERINKLVLSFQPDTPWEGFSKGDMEKFDSIFSEKANDYSCCPVCMRYVQREDGCMYMSHNCYNEPGADTVDDYWYNMYKNAEGKIFWCTICGRICLGHRHYTLGATKAKLELVPVQADADPFAKDCTNEGGGGLREKLTRFTAFRELAYELQKEVGKIPRKKALGELVQEMWSAPISRLSLRRAKNNLETKKFRLPANTFPNPVASNNAPNIVRNARNAELLPTVAPGYNVISTTDDEKVIQFHHRKQDGEINHHEDPNEERIGAESFKVYIESNLSDGIAGPCWLKSCTAKIHPDEIKELVRLEVFPEDLYKRYKDAFNRLQRGGGQNILQEAKTAKCVVWNTKKSNRKTRRNRRKGRKTRRYIR